MSDRAKIGELASEIASHRARAEQARRLASQVNDALTHHTLLKHAEQLEHEAEGLEVQMTVLKEITPPEGEDIANQAA